MTHWHLVHYQQLNVDEQVIDYAKGCTCTYAKGGRFEQFVVPVKMLSLFFTQFVNLCCEVCNNEGKFRSCC